VYICIYVFMCLCVYLCVYVYIYINIYVCICVFMYVFMCVFVYLSMYLCVYLCMFIYICVYVCMFIYIYLCVCVCVCERHGAYGIWHMAYGMGREDIVCGMIKKHYNFRSSYHDDDHPKGLTTHSAPMPPCPHASHRTCSVSMYLCVILRD
jgi:hypothetical protein